MREIAEKTFFVIDGRPSTKPSLLTSGTKYLFQSFSIYFSLNHKPYICRFLPSIHCDFSSFHIAPEKIISPYCDIQAENKIRLYRNIPMLQDGPPESKEPNIYIFFSFNHHHRNQSTNLFRSDLLQYFPVFYSACFGTIEIESLTQGINCARRSIIYNIFQMRH